ncbi:MAG: Elongation factor P [Microgenomates bacterium OLB22]|nr:MAG: Elongation factor P [Microgenomates bacterium OLB22]
MEKTKATQLKKGNILQLDGAVWVVVSSERNFRGRGAGSVTIKMRNVKTGASVSRNYRSDELFELMQTQTLPLQYLYKTGESLFFMNPLDYEQYELAAELVGDLAKYLKEEQTVHVMMYENTPLSIIPPKSVRLKVTAAEDAVKGDTTGNAKKPVTLETGATIMAPLFIKPGEEIIVNAETGEYVERANN